MINITDKARKPQLSEIAEYIGNDLFGESCEALLTGCNAAYEVAYSGDKNLPGWNVRFYKSGRTLCRLYPNKGYFLVLIVVGRREKEKVEALSEQMSDEMQAVYNSTAEGMGQRWLILEIKKHNALYDDLLRLVGIRMGK